MCFLRDTISTAVTFSFQMILAIHKRFNVDMSNLTPARSSSGFDHTLEISSTLGCRDVPTLRPIGVIWGSEFLLSGMSARDLVDEYYIRTFSKCRDLYCHTMDKDKLDIPVYDSDAKPRTVVIDGGLGKLLTSSIDVGAVDGLPRKGIRDRTNSRSIDTLPPLRTTKDISQALTCTDAIFVLKVALVSDLASQDICQTRKNGAKMSQNLNLFTSCSRLLPAPYVDSLPEHVFIEIWGAELMTPLHLAEILNSYYHRISENKAATSTRDPTATNTDDDTLRSCNSLLAWKVGYSDRLGCQELCYHLQLCRFHHYLLRILGESIMINMFMEAHCDNTPVVSSNPTEKKKRKAAKDPHWQERRSMGEIRAVMADLIEAIEYAGNVTDKSISICLLDSYLLFKTPPVSPRNRENAICLNDNEKTNSSCSCDAIRIRKVDAIMSVLPTCADKVVRGILTSTDFVICASIVITHGLLSGDAKVLVKLVNCTRTIRNCLFMFFKFHRFGERAVGCFDACTITRMNLSTVYKI